MSHNKFIVSAIQMECQPNNKKKNIEKAVSLVNEAIQKKSKLMVLPEIFTSGYYCFNKRDPTLFKEAESIPGPTTDVFSQIARENGVHILTPIFENRHGVFFNTSVLIGPSGKVIGKYEKTHIPLSGGALEKYYFRPGSNFPVFSTKIGNIGIVTCYDRLFPETFRIVSIKGADIVLVPSTIYPQKEPKVGDDWEYIAKTRAKENCVYAVFVNRTGKEEGLYYFGNSLVVNPEGKIIARAGFEECILNAEINLDDVNEIRQRRFYLRDRRPEIYKKLTEFNNLI
jgi:N-carbamoylputrescine amidase